MIQRKFRKAKPEFKKFLVHWFTYKQTGAVTVSAKDEDDAKARFRKMARGNADIYSVKEQP